MPKAKLEAYLSDIDETIKKICEDESFGEIKFHKEGESKLCNLLGELYDRYSNILIDGYGRFYLLHQVGTTYYELHHYEESVHFLEEALYFYEDSEEFERMNAIDDNYEVAQDLAFMYEDLAFIYGELAYHSGDLKDYTKLTSYLEKELNLHEEYLEKELNLHEEYGDNDRLSRINEIKNEIKNYRLSRINEIKDELSRIDEIPEAQRNVASQLAHRDLVPTSEVKKKRYLSLIGGGRGKGALSGLEKELLSTLQGENMLNTVRRDRVVASLISSILSGAGAKAKLDAFKDFYDLLFDEEGKKTKYLTDLEGRDIKLSRVSSILNGVGAKAKDAFKDFHDLLFDEEGKKTKYLTDLEGGGIKLSRMSSILNGVGAKA